MRRWGDSIARAKQGPRARALVEISRVVQTAEMDDGMRRRLKDARGELARVRAWPERLDRAMRDLEAEDRLGNLEIQRLMSAFNEAETLLADMLKKRDCIASAIIAKIA